MKWITLSIISIFSACGSLMAQSEPQSQIDQALRDSSYYSADMWAEKEAHVAQRPQKVSGNVNMNTYFGSSGMGNHYGFGISPTVTVPLSKKFDLTVGVDVNQMYYSGSAMVLGGPNGETWTQKDVNTQYTSAIIHATGTYYVNDRLTVWGSVYANANPDVPSNMPVWGVPQMGVTVGADYKISDRARVGFQFSYQEGMPYYGPGTNGMGFNPNYGMYGGFGSPFRFGGYPPYRW